MMSHSAPLGPSHMMGPPIGPSPSPGPRGYRTFTTGGYTPPYHQGYYGGTPDFTPRSTPAPDVSRGYQAYEDSQQAYGCFSEVPLTSSPDAMSRQGDALNGPKPLATRHNSDPSFYHNQQQQQLSEMLLPAQPAAYPNTHKRRALDPAHSKQPRKHHSGSRSGNGQGDSYFLPTSRTPSPPARPSSPPPSTLTNSEYRDIFAELNTVFCASSFRWLARHRFRIPRKAHMRPHLQPEDRELTEYVSIIKGLIEGREVPRSAVRDERISELVSVMEGAAEIRHVAIHVSRKQKPDRRVLGFVAAVAEFCWVLGDEAAAERMNVLYEEVEEMLRGRR